MRYRHIYISIIITTLIFVQINGAVAKSEIVERKKLLEEEAALIQRNEKKKVPEVSDLSVLNDYVKIGLARNPGLKAAFYEWKSAFNKIAQSFSLPDPQFTFTDFIEEVETRVGPQERAFSIKQRFPLPDKLWIRKSKAFKASEIAYYNFEKKRLNLMFQIADAYYEYAYLNKAIILTKENLKLLQSFESVTRTKYVAGLQKNQDLLKVQVELGKLENDLYSLKDLRSSLVARLNALLNLPEDNALSWPNEKLEELAFEDKYKDVSVIVHLLKEKNPKLQALSKNVEKNRESLKLSKREYFPDLTVGITQINTDNALNSATIDSGKDPVMLIFSINVPIWFGRLKAGVREARASLKAAENRVLNTKNELVSKLELVHYKMRDSLRQSHLYKDALIPKVVQTLNAQYSAYSAGSVDFLSLIDAQRILLNFQLAFYRHNANFYQRLREVESLIGGVEIYTKEEL